MDATTTNPANGSIIDLPLDLIKNDRGTEVRTPDPVVYMEYRERVIAGDEFPYIVVFWDGTDFIMADGRHRFYGHREAKCKTIKAKILHGDATDALWFAAGCNQTHGKRRTNVDKRDALKALLLNEKFVTFSDSKLGNQAAVDHKTVASVRAELESTGEIPKLTERVGTDGKSRPATKTVAARQATVKAATAAYVKQWGTPETIAAVRQGQMSLDDAVHASKPNEFYGRLNKSADTRPKQQPPRIPKD